MGIEVPIRLGWVGGREAEEPPVEAGAEEVGGGWGGASGVPTACVMRWRSVMDRSAPLMEVTTAYKAIKAPYFVYVMHSRGESPETAHATGNRMEKE